MTAVANSIFTAAQFNQYVRDNLNQCPAALATAADQIFVSTGTNQLMATRVTSSRVATTESTTSGAYTDLTTVGPQVTVTTAGMALVIISAAMNNNGNNNSTSMSFQVSGASTIGASDANRICMAGVSANYVNRYSSVTLLTASYGPLTPGSNTFTAKYATAGGTATYQNRELSVIPL